MGSLSEMLNSAGFMPHGHCFLWTPALLWSYVAADTLIGLAYYSIPVTLWYVVRNRSDLPFTWAFSMFAVFIFACGTTHLIAVVNIWQPVYWLDAGIKVATAVASVFTAFALWPLVPEALAIPNQRQLQSTNLHLAAEVSERKKIEAQLLELNASLERRVAERTAELEAGNLALQREVAERNVAQQALVGERSLLRTLIDSLPEVVFSKDSAGRFTMCNAAQIARFGLSNNEEAIGKTVFDLYPRSLAVVFDASDREALAGRSVLYQEEPGVDAAGNQRWFLTTKVPLRDAEGRIVGLVGLSRDVTERKRADEARRRSQKLEALGTLAGGVAHDFNNLLLAITGNSRLAKDDLPEGHPARLSLDEIGKAASRATDLVHRILTFTRDKEPVRLPIQLPPIVDEAVKLLRATLPAMIAIDVDTSAELPTVRADASQIHQIVMNLGTNAAYAIGQRTGRIELTLKVVNVGAEMIPAVPELRGGTYVQLSLTDDGCGMDKDTLERIFDPFFTTKPSGEGTGLGLSVVHGIVASHGGAITAYSVPGSGSTFKVYFPALETEAAAIEARRRDPPRGSGERVLYLDDEESLVLLGSRMLQRRGYRIEGFTDPVEALRAFRSRPHDYDVVVTDLSMPGMSGLEFAQAIRDARPDTPIVITSGYLRAEDQQRAVELGVRATILKPNTVDELAEALDRVFRAAGRRG